jgi:hypothetical protein
MTAFPEAEAQVLVLRAEWRKAWRAAQQKIRSLEMVVANDKKEMYEDPLIVHEMHAFPPPRDRMV